MHLPLRFLWRWIFGIVRIQFASAYDHALNCCGQSMNLRGSQSCQASSSLMEPILNCLFCSTDLGREYARKLEQLRREEELIQEEELEAEALEEVDAKLVDKVWLWTSFVCEASLIRRL